MVLYNNKKYYIDIVETKPSSAISIIETDCEVDFAPPLDYKETEKTAPSVCSRKTPPEGLYLIIICLCVFLGFLQVISSLSSVYLIKRC